MKTRSPDWKKRPGADSVRRETLVRTDRVARQGGGNLSCAASLASENFGGVTDGCGLRLGQVILAFERSIGARRILHRRDLDREPALGGGVHYHFERMIERRRLFDTGFITGDLIKIKKPQHIIFADAGIEVAAGGDQTIHQGPPRDLSFGQQMRLDVANRGPGQFGEGLLVGFGQFEEEILEIHPPILPKR